jgi:hypothetical protein
MQHDRQMQRITRTAHPKVNHKLSAALSARIRDGTNLGRIDIFSLWHVI